MHDVYLDIVELLIFATKNNDLLFKFFTHLSVYLAI
jgi:hypothetical protein